MKGRILIVDDDPIVRLDIRNILEAADYEVVAEASDGFEAIDLCQKYRCDLVMMDIKLPLLDGLTAGKKILEDALAYSVILLSAYSDEHYVQKAKTNGISAYLVKPLDAKSLIPMVEVCIEKGRQLQQMSRDHLSEPEAFKRIRTISMQKRVPMIEIAKLLVLQDDV